MKRKEIAQTFLKFKYFSEKLLFLKNFVTSEGAALTMFFFILLNYQQLSVAPYQVSLSLLYHALFIEISYCVS